MLYDINHNLFYPRGLMYKVWAVLVLDQGLPELKKI